MLILYFASPGTGGSRGPYAERYHLSLLSVLILLSSRLPQQGVSEVAQSCPTLCDPMDYSLPGSSVHGILQARVLEWVTNKGRRMLMTSSISQMTSTATSAERGHLFLTVPAKIQGACVHSRARLSATPWPASLLCPWGFPDKNTAVGCHSPLQGIFPTQGSNRRLWQLLHCQVGSLALMPPGIPTWFSQVRSWRWCQSPAGHMHHKWARCIIPKRNPVLLPRKHKQLLSPTWTLTVYVESSTNNNHFSNPSRLGGGKRGSRGRGDINTWSWFILLYSRN